MYPTYVLQMLWDGDWQEIGWRASTPRSLADLKRHGSRMAATGEAAIRLVALSPFLDGEPTVVTTFPEVAA